MASTKRQLNSNDLRARNLDLATALFKQATESNSSMPGAWDIEQWLEVEKVDQFQLLFLLEKSKERTLTAGRYGQEFYHQVIDKIEAIPTGPLFLGQPIPLGQLLAVDSNLSWLLSTIASLLEHTRDYEHISRTMVLKAGGGMAGTMNKVDDYRRPDDPEALPLRHFELKDLLQIMRKIILSVLHHVVNCGCEPIGTPAELLSVCPRGHTLSEAAFMMVTGGSLSSLPTIVLQTTHLLRDALIWLLLHYDGKLIVDVGGRTLYQAQLGNAERELQWQVEAGCPEAGPCQHRNESYSFYRDRSGKFASCVAFGGSSGRGHPTIPLRQINRRILYDISSLHPYLDIE
jgi:hypothetical protein